MSLEGVNGDQLIEEFLCIYSSEKDQYLSEIAIETHLNSFSSHMKYSYEYGWCDKLGDICNIRGVKQYHMYVFISEINVQTSDRIRIIARELNDNMFNWWFIPCRIDQTGNVTDYHHTGAGKVLAELI